MRKLPSIDLSLRQAVRKATRVAPLVLVGLLLVVVAGVGLIGAIAETQQTWQWYFRMEQAVAVATPIALVLSAASLASLFGAILFIKE